MSARRLTVATRKSPLALAQCRAWTGELATHGFVVEELHVTTTGDRVQDRSLSEVGGKGLFTKEIEEALLDGRADFAVHSLKDVPAVVPDGLVLGSVSQRADFRDVLVSRTGATFEELPRACKVGTSSLRRIAQLRELRPDLSFVPLRGNVETRLTRCREGAVEAVVLAMAGLARLGLSDRVTQIFDPEQCLPAVAQGALVAEQRADDVAVAQALESLDHRTTRLFVAAERGLMKAVFGNCQTPVAALALEQGGLLWLRGFLARPDGSEPRRAEVIAAWPQSFEEAERIGFELGGELRARVG